MIYTQLCFLLILWLFVPSSLGNLNLASRRETSQSSTVGQGVSSRAVDGDRDTNYFARGGCTQTLSSLSPWWRVDLGKEYPISYLTITNRGDCCSDRLSNVEIRIGNSLADNGNDNPKCGWFYALKNAETMNISCPGMKGRYVNIRIPGINKTLTLCEVEVYANDSRNLALRKGTTQSSVTRDGFSNRAVDGDRSTNYYNGGQCSLTLPSTSPWWRVDLGQEYPVSYLIITNRGDCCAARLSNFEIRIGNSLANNGNQNPKCGKSYSMTSAEIRNIICPAPMNGRYVNIRIPGRLQILTLCEVEVYAEEKSSNDDNGSIREKWYLFLITCICGILVGVMSLFAIQCLHRKLRKRNSEAEVIPEMIESQ